MTAKPGMHPDFWGAYLTLKSCIIYVSFGLDVLPTLRQNAVQTASDCMSFDIKSITGKIYQHFHIHALNDEVLMSFGKLKVTGSTDILGHSNIWWVFPLTSCWNDNRHFSLPRKPVCFSSENCPIMHKNCFENPHCNRYPSLPCQAADIFFLCHS